MLISSPVLLGGLNLRGHVIPVLDLQGLCGLPPQERGAFAVILRRADRLLAFPVDEVIGIARITGDRVQAVTNASAASTCVRSVFLEGERSISIVELDEIFDLPEVYSVEAPRIAQSRGDDAEREPVLIFDVGGAKFVVRAEDVYGTVPRQPIEVNAISSGFCMGSITYHGCRVGQPPSGDIMSHHATPRANALLLDRHLSLADAGRIARGELAITLSEAAIARCRAAHDRLGRIIAEDRHVYGITTGFGPLANRLVGAEHGVMLQQNLVHHLASGVGPRFGHAQARAIVLARLMSILQGVSGASFEAINRLVAVLNAGLAPVIPSKGTVGASGDLTPLAHLVLCLQGRGAFFGADGIPLPAELALERMGLTPLDLARRDGLALVNGTSAMTGVAVLNALATSRALSWSIALTAALAEVPGARMEAWHPAFAEVRPHPGQRAAAAALRDRVSGSARVERSPLAGRRLTGMGCRPKRRQARTLIPCAAPPRSSAPWPIPPVSMPMSSPASCNRPPTIRSSRGMRRRFSRCMAATSWASMWALPRMRSARRWSFWLALRNARWPG